MIKPATERIQTSLEVIKLESTPKSNYYNTIPIAIGMVSDFLF